MLLFLTVKENSQRVPRKNFRKLGKEELYLRCINKFSKKYQMIVDTDSDEIFNKIYNFKNVYTYKRAKHLIGDEVSTDELIKDCITRLNYNMNLPKDPIICHVFATAPFLKLETLQHAEKVFMNPINNCDSLFSADFIQKRLWRKESYGLSPVNHNPLKLEQTQDLPPLYIENSIFYIFNKHIFEKYNCRICGNSMPCSVEFPENIDIDTEEDFNLCKKIIKIL
jgi:CMP-N-acetylneuraminic acid synthetase